MTDRPLALRTNDGTVHSANTWHDLLRSAHPQMEPEQTMAVLIKKAKDRGYDVLHGQDREHPPTADQLLWRLHECEMIQLVAHP